MIEIVKFNRPTRAIVHFAADEGRGRVIYYQVLIDTTIQKNVSPSGDFIRFEHGDSEIHGWIRTDDLVIDEVLEVMEAQVGRAEAA